MAMLEAQQDAASGRGERSVEADKARTPTPTALPPRRSYSMRSSARRLDARRLRGRAWQRGLREAW